MASTYLPLQLIHVHLPAPPSIPLAIPELRIPTDRPFPQNPKALAEPLHPDHAASSIREPSTGLLARSIRNGYTLELRTLNPVVAKDKRRDAEGSEIIRIVFPDKLLPLTEGCLAVSEREGKLFILVVTEATVVYRLSFPLGYFRPGRDDRFAFSTKSEDWCEEYEVPEEVINACAGVGSWIVLDEQTVVLGGGDGGIVRLTRSGENGSVYWTAAHYRPSAKFRLPSLFSRSQTDDQVVSFARHTTSGTPLLYALSRDRRLRTWHVETGSCLRTIDVRPSTSTEMVQYTETTPPRSTSSPSSIPIEGITQLKVLRHPSSSSRYSHLVLAFYPTPQSSSSAGCFVVYRGSDNASGANELVYAGARTCSSASAGLELRGYEILPAYAKDNISTGWRVQAAWDGQGGLLFETIVMDDIFQFTTYLDHPSSFLLTDWQQATRPNSLDQYDAAYFDILLGPEGPDPASPNDNSDITITFIDHLFHPGRFSILSLSCALDEYTQTLPRQRTSQMVIAANGLPTLQQRFASIVGCHLQLELDLQTGAPVVEAFRKDLKLDWLGIWGRVRELDRQGRWGINTAVVGDQVLVLTREGVSAACAQDVAGVIARFAGSPEAAADFRALPISAFWPLHPVLVTPKARSGAIALSAAGSYISSTLSRCSAEEGSLNALEDVTGAMKAMFAAGIQQPIEMLAGEIWEEAIEPYLSDEDRTAVRRLLSECLDIRLRLGDALANFTRNQTIPSGQLAPGESYSSFGNALITASVASTISDRYTASLNLLFIALFHLSESAGVTSEDEDAEDFIELLNQIFVVYHRCSVMKWLSTQTAEEGVESSRTKGARKRAVGGDDILAEGLGGLRVGNNEGASDGFDGTYSVIHSLLDSQRRQPVNTGSVDDIAQAAEGFISAAGVITDDVIEVDPTFQDINFGYSILATGLPLLAGRYADLYPLSAGMAYIRGRAALEAGIVGEAVRSFEQAAVGCKGQCERTYSGSSADVLDGSIAELLPSCAGASGATAFHQHIASLFADHSQHGPVVHFGQLALLSLPSDTPSPRSLWTTVFLAYNALGQYEDAYALLMKTPYLDLQRDFLGQLISVMCESNEVGRLNQLGFVGMQKEVEALLSFKARNSDPLRYPNYYKVLYSWYISRGDYRSAGDIMYQQGRRFGESGISKVSAFELAAMQARSYLAAINALKLIEKRNAWVSLPGSPPKALRGSKRKRMSAFVPEDNFSKDCPAISIITLEDIEVEYALVLARLRLSSQIQDLNEHGISVSPEEVIGLLVQRSMFDLALSAASTMNVDMTNIFVTIATKCVELSRLSDQRGDTISAAWLHTSPLTSRLRGSPSALAQRYLQTTLSQHDSAKTHFAYRRAVSNTFFELNADKSTGWQMPAWLVEWEMDRDAEGWISSALRFGWVEEAIDWSAELLRRAVPPELLSKRPDSANVPYNLIDRVLAAAGEGEENDDKKVQRKAVALKEAVDRRTQGMKKLEAW